VKLEQWHQWSRTLVEILGMETKPVAVSCLKKPCPSSELQHRLCRVILEVAKGKKAHLAACNNACFGAAWHLGFIRLEEPKTAHLIKKFVVEGEKLFSSYQALENLIAQMGEVPDNKDSCFYLYPLEEVDFEPQLIIFVVNPEVACRLLTLAIFPDGQMPQIKIGGPTCRMAVTYPLISQQMNISFYDYTARKMSGVERDKLLISIPAKRLPLLLDSISRCSAGTARVEFPPEFRQFLQKRLAGRASSRTREAE